MDSEFKMEFLKDDVRVHETAYIDKPSIIGRGTRIWHFSHVLSGTRIGGPLVRNDVLRQAILAAALRAGIDAS